MSETLMAENQPLQTTGAQSAQAYARVENTLIDQLNPHLADKGIEIVSLELVTHRQKTLRLFIDFIPQEAPSTTSLPTTESQPTGITVDICAEVSKFLEPYLDNSEVLNRVFSGEYELEVSSPGLERPLRLARDFLRFKGQDCKIQTFRPLSAEEMTNAEYQSKNPKQKQFFGILMGLSENSNQVLIQIRLEGSKAGVTKKTKPKPNAKKATPPLIAIPLELISKAHLEPTIDWSGEPQLEL